MEDGSDRDAAVTNLRQQLEACGGALPVLFIGSGFAQRYIGSPTWSGLLEKFAAVTGRPFSYYRASADGDLPQIASLIAEEFFDIWYSDPRYEASRAEFGDLVESKSDPLKYEVARYLRELKFIDQDWSRAERDAFTRIHVQAVLTTNWDSVIERLIPEFETFIGQNDVLFTSMHAVGEVYKIHGCASRPASLILTREDYENYWERNPYLIAKMLTLFVEHPVLFVGYSLTDSHIQKLLGNLVSCLTAEQVGVLNERLVFVRRLRKDERGSSFTTGSITIGSHVLSIRELAIDDFRALYEMLASLPRKFPAKLMRQFKDSVYKLAFDSTVTSTIHVLPFKDDADLDKVEMVIGVGTMARLAALGYGHYRRSDLVRDMLDAQTEHDPDRLVKRLLAEQFSRARYNPLYYPLVLAKRLRSDGTVEGLSDLHEAAQRLLKNPTSIEDAQSNVSQQTRSKSFRQLLGESERRAKGYGVICTYGVEDVVALREFLRVQVADEAFIDTDVAKLACKYDQLVFGFGFEGDRLALLEALGLDPEVWSRN